MSIRMATLDDVPALTRMASSFILFGQHQHFGSHITPNELTDRISEVLSTGAVECFVAEMEGEIVGMLACTVIGAWFAPHILIATELAWWMDEKARRTTLAIRMVRAYETWAKDKGVQFVTMSSLSLDNGTSVSNMLTRMGYTPSETTHTKGIT